MDYNYMAVQLRGEYREVFEKTEVYGVFSEVDTDIQDDRMMNLFDLLMTAQSEGKPVEKIVGPDMEKFCKEYYRSYDRRERMRRFLVDLYRLMRMLFILELVDLFCQDEMTDLFHAQSDILPYLGGIGLSLILTMVADLFVRPMIFRLHIKPMVYYFGFLLLWVAAIALCVWLTDGMILEIPLFPILLVSGIYVMVYLVVRSVWRYRRYGSIRRPRSEAEEFERSAERASIRQLMLDTMLKRYKKKNQRLQKKGKKGLTPGEYTEQVRTEHKKLQHSWKWGILIFAAIIVPAVVSVAVSSTLWDTVLFTLVLLVIEGGIYWFTFKIERKNNQIRKDILDVCDSEGISVVEYAMKKADRGIG